MGLEVAIVTLSQQANLVSKVLRLSMPRDCDTARIAVRGGQRRLVKEDGELACPEVEGARKQRHIASVLESRCARGESALQPHRVLLIYDDSMNVQEALESGTRALLFSPDNPLFLVCGIDPASSFDDQMHIGSPAIFAQHAEDQ